MNTLVCISAAVLRMASRLPTLPVVALLLFTAPSFARDVPPTELIPVERAAWWLSQCAKLGAEVENIEALRNDYKALDDAAERLSAQVKMKNGELVYKRLQYLERETERNSSESARRRANQEHVSLYAKYTRRMDQLISQDEMFKSRNVRTYKQMTDNLVAAERKWNARQSRYPLAKSERDVACEESKRAEAEAERLKAQSTPRPKSSRFRARIDWTAEFTIGVVAIGYIGIEVQQYNDGLWSPGMKLNFREGIRIPYTPAAGVAVSLDAHIAVPGLGGTGPWSEEFSVQPPMRTEDFRGLTGGVTVHPALNVVTTLAGGQMTLHFDNKSGPRINVPVTTGQSFGLGLTAVTQYGGIWK